MDCAAFFSQRRTAKRSAVGLLHTRIPPTAAWALLRGAALTLFSYMSDPERRSGGLIANMYLRYAIDITIGITGLPAFCDILLTVIVIRSKFKSPDNKNRWLE